MKVIFSIVFSIFLVVSTFCQSPTFSVPELLKIKKIEKAFTGSFDNKKQADTTKIKMLAHQKVRILRIWKKEKPGEYWIYSGWFYGEDESTPFQEAIYQTIDVQGDTMIMQAYLCPTARKKGLLREKEWAQPDAFTKLPQEELLMYCKFAIFPHGEGYRMESRPYVVESLIPGSSFDRISLIIERFGKQFNLLNEFYLKGETKPFIIPGGVKYDQITTNPKLF